jgi:hypothetical protein
MRAATGLRQATGGGGRRTWQGTQRFAATYSAKSTLTMSGSRTPERAPTCGKPAAPALSCANADSLAFIRGSLCGPLPSPEVAGSLAKRHASPLSQFSLGSYPRFTVSIGPAGQNKNPRGTKAHHAAWLPAAPALLRSQVQNEETRAGACKNSRPRYRFVPADWPFT